MLEKVNCSEWATPLVPVPKRDGNFWLCDDYKVMVNPALEVDKHPLPHHDELMATLTGGQHFTKLDLTAAYQQMILEEESRVYETINTHKGSTDSRGSHLALHQLQPYFRGLWMQCCRGSHMLFATWMTY